MSGTERPSYAALDRIGRIRLSDNFFLRDFLYSEIAVRYGLANVPDDLALATEAGTKLCRELLEPLQARFGRVHIRSAFRSCEVNALGNRMDHNCASNEANYAAHIWDRKDRDGNIGATACIVIPAIADRLRNDGDWTQIAWWIHDNLPYSTLYFFTQLTAFNIQWRENPVRQIDSYAKWEDGDGWKNKGTLTKPGKPNFSGFDKISL